MLKLTRHEMSSGETVIRLDGCLTAETVTQLSDLVAAEAPRTMIDLGGLTTLDRDGRSALLRLQSSGTRLRGGSLYIQTLLEEV